MGEIAAIAREEQVVHLIDVLKRRTSLAFVGAVTADVLAEVAEIVGDALDWSAPRRVAEIEHARAELHDVHGVAIEERRIAHA